MTEPVPDASKQALLRSLAPILAHIAGLQPHEQTSPESVRALEAELERAFPYEGEQVQALGQLIARGVREGWLADRGEGEATFGRVAKPGPSTHQMSVDVVSMRGEALDHSHPKGEITLGFPVQPDGSQNCQFESRAPAWVFLGPGSRHIPRVDGARMNLIYFLPEGAVEWHRG